jgi:deoxyguanosine kinase
LERQLIPYKYIAIEGNIGAGKSTLTNFLADHFRAIRLMEEFEENESLKDFYANPDFALQAELQFLLDRNRQLHSFHKKEHALIIADYIPQKSLLFAKLNLSPKDFKLYSPMAHNLLSSFPQPDLIIYLKRSTDELVHNIAKRGREYEEQIDRSYLDRLNKVYQTDLVKLSNCPILEIEAKDINLRKPEELRAAFNRILQKQYASQVRQINLATMLNFDPLS